MRWILLLLVTVVVVVLWYWLRARSTPPQSPRIVAAVMTASGPSPFAPDKSRARRVEEAMAKAVTEAIASGIPIGDSAAIRARMMAARDQALRD
jgi:4-amino-4-deoxy-L-arabinose transferase-like glycosyltransferase